MRQLVNQPPACRKKHQIVNSLVRAVYWVVLLLYNWLTNRRVKPPASLLNRHFINWTLVLENDTLLHHKLYFSVKRSFSQCWICMIKFQSVSEGQLFSKMKKHLLEMNTVWCVLCCWCECKVVEQSGASEIGNRISYHRSSNCLIFHRDQVM